MNTEIRYPTVNGKTEAEQIGQIKTYLFTLADSLSRTLTLLEERTRGPYSAEGKALSRGEGEFEAIKPHIVSSAEVMNACFSTVNRRLKGRYVAKDDFSSYVEDTDLRLEANSRGIDQLYTRMENMDSLTESMDTALTSVTAHIRSGYLCDDADGNPVYGVEIGQTTVADGVETFNKFARFSAGRLTFYDDEGNELAHISGNLLSVPAIETGSQSLLCHVCDRFTLTGSVGDVSAEFSVRKWSDGSLEATSVTDLSHIVSRLESGTPLTLAVTLPEELSDPSSVTAFTGSDVPMSVSYDHASSSLVIAAVGGVPTSLRVTLSLTAQK